MRITSEGQVTIPIEIRHKYGITPEMEVEFVETDAGPLLRINAKSREERARRLIARLSGSATSGFTTDEIMRFTRGWGEPDPGFDEADDATRVRGAEDARDQ